MTSLFPSPVMSLFPSLDRGRPVGPRPANRPGDPWEQTLRAVGDLAEAGVAALVLETEDGFVRLGRAREIAGALGAEHLSLDDLTTKSLVLHVRQRRAAAPAGRAR